MKVLLTFDFPPQKSGIGKYLYGIVEHRYTANDHVIIAQSEKAELSGFQRTVRILTRWNTKN